MRLGAAGGQTSDPKFKYFGAEGVDGLEKVVEKLDRYGLGAIAAPVHTGALSDDECIAFGEKAESLGLVISEVWFLRNLHAPTPELRQQRVEEGRMLLRKADLMHARCLLGFAGSANPADSHGLGDPYNFTDAFKADLRELILRVLDDIDLEHTHYGLEANHKTFYYEPEGCAELIAAVDHPRFGVHLDIVNMISQASYWDTTSLIDTTFELLGDRIWAAHLKDLRVDDRYHGLKYDEVIVGDGNVDLRAFLGHLSNYDTDFPCMCEHLAKEEDYIVSFERLHEVADDLKTPWVRRGPLAQG
jgi:sugar phosphate isomerase/epimerase